MVKNEEGRSFREPLEILLRIRDYYATLYKEKKEPEYIHEGTETFCHNLTFLEQIEGDKNLCDTVVIALIKDSCHHHPETVSYILITRGRTEKILITVDQYH